MKTFTKPYIELVVLSTYNVVSTSECHPDCVLVCTKNCIGVTGCNNKEYQNGFEGDN